MKRLTFDRIALYVFIVIVVIGSATVGALIGLHTMTAICKAADCIGGAYVVGCAIYLRAERRRSRRVARREI